MRIAVGWGLGCVLAVFIVVPAMARADPPAADFVAGWEARVRAVHASLSGDAALALGHCREFVAAMLDLDTMAHAAAAANWARMSAAQRAAYRNAFDDRIAEECVRRVGDYDGERFEIMGMRLTSDGERIVIASLGPPATSHRTIAWRLRPAAGGGLRAVDVIIEGRSQLAEARDDFARVLANNRDDIDASIAALRQR